MKANYPLSKQWDFLICGGSEDMPKLFLRALVRILPEV